jgi:hypothetical protein
MIMVPKDIEPLLRKTQEHIERITGQRVGMA